VPKALNIGGRLVLYETVGGKVPKASGMSKCPMSQ
jgi:hypothetical protein